MKKSQAGFTLIEIIIALFIFAILAVIAAVGLRTVLRTHSHVTLATNRIQQMEIAMTLMRRDFTQMIARPVVDNSGQLIPAINVSSNNAIEFTRTGDTNPEMLLPHSTLQRVAFSFSNNELIRSTWPVLDRTSATKPSQRILLKNVSSMNLRYVDDKGQEVTNWVGATGADSAQQAKLPRAVVVTLQLKNVGKMQAIFPVAARGALQ